MSHSKLKINHHRVSGHYKLKIDMSLNILSSLKLYLAKIMDLLPLVSITDV